jgi:hypothetical protein
MAIAAVNGAKNSSSSGVTTLSVTYSPTAGNLVIVGLFFSATVSSLVVKDSLGNTLSAGPNEVNSYLFYETGLASGITGFTATWTGSAQVGMAVEEYSGATSVNTAPPAGSTIADGTSASATISTYIGVANNFIVAVMGSANTLTTSVGNQRQQTTTGSARVTLQDNTAATAYTSVTNTATLTSASWYICAVEIGNVGRARVDQDVELVIKQATNLHARVAQDVELVIKQPTNANARVAQDVELVISKPTTARARVAQDVILVIHKNPSTLPLLHMAALRRRSPRPRRKARKAQVIGISSFIPPTANVVVFAVT